MDSLAKYKYIAELIRAHPDPFRRGETVEIARECDTFADAMKFAEQYGAIFEHKKARAPYIKDVRAYWRCRDPRFDRVQIRIKPLA